MKERLYLVPLIILLHASWGYAVDCTQSFDQSCLSGDYSSETVDADYEQRQKNLDAHFKAVDEEEKLEAKIEEKERQEEEKERRHQERIDAEYEKAAAMREQSRRMRQIDLGIEELNDRLGGW